MKKLILTGRTLSLADVYACAHASPSALPTVSLEAKAKQRIAKAHNYVQKLSTGKAAVYGVNTGFGLLSDVRIPEKDLAQLQINLLRSHAVGVGAPLSRAEVRAALLLRANTLCQGHSGVSVELLESLLALLNHDIIPWVPEQGSVGACGDLAPLAHLALVLIGEGKAYVKGTLIDGAKALQSAKLKSYSLRAKEGLALINGTQIMTAIGSLVSMEAIQLAKIADIAGAMSLEAIKGTTKAFHPAIHALRPHPEQISVAKNIIRLLAKSEIAESHKNCGKVQDPYSIRCIPQVHGAARSQLLHSEKILTTEINAVTDNPLVFLPEDMGGKGDGPDGGEIISGGNFHGEYVAMGMDSAAIAIAEIANISDLRMQKLINPQMSGLPAFLTPDPGLCSGMMIVQVAAASLVSENKVLAHPASVDSIPTSADKEDHVSMGTIAARKARQILQNSRNVLAMELLCAAQGLDFLQPLKAGKGAQTAYKFIRKSIKTAPTDRAFHLDIEILAEMIRDGSLLAAVEDATGALE